MKKFITLILIPLEKISVNAKSGWQIDSEGPSTIDRPKVPPYSDC